MCVHVWLCVQGISTNTPSTPSTPCLYNSVQCPNKIKTLIYFFFSLRFTTLSSFVPWLWSFVLFFLDQFFPVRSVYVSPSIHPYLSFYSVDVKNSFALYFRSIPHCPSHPTICLSVYSIHCACVRTVRSPLNARVSNFDRFLLRNLRDQSVCPSIHSPLAIHLPNFQWTLL